jgi:flagellar motility protein MotE (MotC chaperone)
MTGVTTLRGIGLLLGCAWLLMPTLALAQAEQKLSKPLNLGEFAKTKVVKPRAAAKPEAAQAVSQSDQFLTTAAVTKKDAPAGQNLGDAQASASDTDASRFCTNIADAALDARVAWQKKELESAEAKLKVRIAELEAKRSEYEEWLKLRQDFLKKAEDSVVEIYSRMNPEAAALQIASMADDTAAAVLAKLRVREASAILNEMEPARGAHLADTLAGMRRADDGKTKK